MCYSQNLPLKYGLFGTKKSYDLLTTCSGSPCCIRWTAISCCFCCSVVPLGGPSALVPGSCPRCQWLEHFLYSRSAQYPSSQFRLPFGFYCVGTSVTWCWGHQLRSPETWLRHVSHQLDPDQCQFVARSEVSMCPSQGGDVSHFPALQDYESSHAPVPAKYWFREMLLDGDWHLFVLHVMWMTKLRRQARLLLPRVNRFFPWAHRA